MRFSSPTCSAAGFLSLRERLRRYVLVSTLMGLAGCLIAASPSAANHLGPPPGPPSEVPPGIGQPPPGSANPQLPPGVPEATVSVAHKTVILRGRRISVALACKAAGTMKLKTRSGKRLGSDKFECTNYRALAEVKLKRKVAKSLSKKLSAKPSLALRAKFNMGFETLAVNLRLKKLRARATTSTGGVWNSGWLHCGRPGLLLNPGLRVFTPQVNSLGGFADVGFYNAHGHDNWVWWKPYLYFYGHGWWDGGWRGEIYVPPYTTIGYINDFLGYPEEDGSYVAAAVYIWWYDGFKDWNWLYASSPDFGYAVHASYWCELV
jgi:hypothetical protein